MVWRQDNSATPFTGTLWYEKEGGAMRRVMPRLFGSIQPGRSLITVLALVIVMAYGGTEALAKELRFVAQELGKGAIWQPSTVVIEQKRDFQDPLYFVLENPTSIEHEFAVSGLFEILMEKGEKGVLEKLFPGTEESLVPKGAYKMEPIRIKLAPGQTKKILVAPTGLEGPRNLGARYRYFCPIHEGTHMAGNLYVD